MTQPQQQQIDALKTRVKALESRLARVDLIINFAIACLVALAGLLVSGLWYLKNAYLPQIHSLISSLLSLNAIFRERIAGGGTNFENMLSNGLAFLERFL